MFVPETTNSSYLYYTDLEKQIWREISTLTDFRFLKEKLKMEAKASNLPLSDDLASQKSKDIQYCIRQAKEYFESSKTATLVIKPTLIYYGLISLAAALIIRKVRDKCLNNMKESHGLKDKYPEGFSNLGKGIISRKELLKISAEIQINGTFSEIANLNLFEGFTLPIKHNGLQDTSQDYKQSIILKNQYPSLRDIDLLSMFQNIPEIWKEIKLIFNYESLVYQGEAVLSKENITCRISKELNSLNELRRNFRFIEKSVLTESNDFYFFTLSKSEYMTMTPLTKRDINGLQYLVADKVNKFITNDFILYYLTFFIFGSLARYKPVLWRYILEDSIHGFSTLPEILCDSAYKKIPLYFLNEFNNNFYKI